MEGEDDRVCSQMIAEHYHYAAQEGLPHYGTVRRNEGTANESQKNAVIVEEDTVEMAGTYERALALEECGIESHRLQMYIIPNRAHIVILVTCINETMCYSIVVTLLPILLHTRSGE